MHIIKTLPLIQYIQDHVMLHNCLHYDDMHIDQIPAFGNAVIELAGSNSGRSSEWTKTISQAYCRV